MFKSIRIGREGLVAAVCAALCVAVIVGVSAPLARRYIEGGSTLLRQQFAAAYGWRLGDGAPPERVVSGTQTDEASQTYEQLLKGQGMSLEPYLGREVTRCTYEVLNFTEGSGAVMSIFEYGGSIIAAHITTADGCIYGLDGQKCDFYTKYPI